MNLNKSLEYFNPTKDRAKIHIIGCGSVGSTIAENLARCGVTRITLWDFDKVESHNIVNQMFSFADIGNNKAHAVKRIITDINPDAESNVTVMEKGWNGENLSGYVFLCVDNIDLRREIVEKNKNNKFIKAVFDVRTSLESAQHYAADWSQSDQRENLLKSMNFSHDEASAENPVSACGITLGVATTVRIICAFAVNNYINFTKGLGIKKFLYVDCFAMDIIA